MQVGARQGIRVACKMRLLSKAWRSAFDTYRGRLGSMCIEAKGSHHFQEVCSMLPQMGSLYISTTEVDTDFSPLSSLGRLTSLSLSNTCRPRHLPIQQDCLNMGMLPISLKQVNLIQVSMRDSGLQIHLPHLTRLSSHVEGNLPHEVELLPQLLHLKVCHTARSS